MEEFFGMARDLSPKRPYRKAETVRLHVTNLPHAWIFPANLVESPKKAATAIGFALPLHHHRGEFLS